MNLSDDFKKIDNEVNKILKKSEKAVITEYGKSLEKLRTIIRKLYDKYEKDGQLTLTEMAKYDRLLQMEKEINDSLSKLYDSNSNLTKNTLKNVFILTTDKTIESIDKAVNDKEKNLIAIKKTLDIDKTVNEKMAGLHWSERMGKHRNDVIYNVNKTLKEGLSRGSTYKEMSDRLKKELQGNVIQPMRIIRTEGARVYAKAQEESLSRISSAGVKMTKTWKTSKDERVRSKHKAMQDITTSYEEDFILPDGKKTKMPKLSGYAEHDIHCRCFVTIDLVKSEEKEMKNETSKKTVKDSNVDLIKDEKEGIIKDKKESTNINYKQIDAKIEKELQKRSDKIWKKELLGSEQNAIREYSGDYYGITNRYLRNALFPNDDIQWSQTPERVKELDRLLSKNTLGDDLILYRGVSSEEFNYWKNSYVIDTYKSTSIDINITDIFDDIYKIEIHAPKNTKGFYLGNNSMSPKEKEFLINRGQKYRILKIEDTKIEVEIYE